MQTKAVVRLDPEYEVAPDNSDDDGPGIRTGILFPVKIEQEPLDKSNKCSYSKSTTKGEGADAMTRTTTHELKEMLEKLSDEELDEIAEKLNQLLRRGALLNPDRSA